jgi:hypothetical protein
MFEATIGSGLFLLVMFTLVGISTFLYKQITLQYVVNETMRWATIEDVHRSGVRVRNIASYTNAQIKTELERRAGLYNITLTDSDIHICPVGTPNCATEIGSNTTNLFSIATRRAVRILPGLLSFTIRAQAVGRTESRT